GIETLVRAFRQLRETRDDAVLVLVGPDDGYQGRIEQLIKHLGVAKSVVITGLITMPEKLSVYTDSSLVVYPGEHEVFGLVPFEALLCGKPVIVSNDSGCGEIITRQRAGLVVPPHDPQALAEAIEQGLDGGTRIEAMIERG